MPAMSFTGCCVMPKTFHRRSRRPQRLRTMLTGYLMGTVLLLILPSMLFEVFYTQWRHIKQIRHTEKHVRYRKTRLTNGDWLNTSEMSWESHDILLYGHTENSNKLVKYNFSQLRYILSKLNLWNCFIMYFGKVHFIFCEVKLLSCHQQFLILKSFIYVVTGPNGHWYKCWLLNDSKLWRLHGCLLGWVWPARWEILSLQAFLPIVQFPFSQNIARNAT